MTQVDNSLNVTAAFYSQLDALCIKEFPCGYGTWVNLKKKLVQQAFFSCFSSSQIVYIFVVLSESIKCHQQCKFERQ